MAPAIKRCRAFTVSHLASLRLVQFDVCVSPYHQILILILNTPCNKGYNKNFIVKIFISMSVDQDGVVIWVLTIQLNTISELTVSLVTLHWQFVKCILLTFILDTKNVPAEEIFLTYFAGMEVWWFVTDFKIELQSLLRK